MTIDQLNDASADIATDLPADENACCELGCDACEPSDCPLCESAPCVCPVSDDPEMLYERVAVLTAEMSDEQRRELSELLLSGEVDAELLALVLRDQATVESDGQWGVGMVPALIAHEHAVTNSLARMGLSSEPLAPEAIEVVRTPSWHRHCGCGRLRARIDDGTIGHKAGCPEVS